MKIGLKHALLPVISAWLLLCSACVNEPTLEEILQRRNMQVDRSGTSASLANPSKMAREIVLATPATSPTPTSPEGATTMTPSDKVALFSSDIPNPSQLKDLTSSEQEQATTLWLQRWEKSKTNAFEVLKMYVDAYLVASGNQSLARQLLAPLTIGGSSTIAPQPIATASQGRGAATIRSYFKGTQPSDNFAISDFKQRQLQVAQDTNSLAPVPADNPASLSPANASPGSVYTFALISNATQIPRRVVLKMNSQGEWQLEAANSLVTGI